MTRTLVYEPVQPLVSGLRYWPHVGRIFNPDNPTRVARTVLEPDRVVLCTDQPVAFAADHLRYVADLLDAATKRPLERHVVEVAE